MRELKQPLAKVHRVQELRRSSASGSHIKKKKDRLNTRRKAIQQDRNS